MDREDVFEHSMDEVSKGAGVVATVAKKALEHGMEDGEEEDERPGYLNTLVYVAKVKANTVLRRYYENYRYKRYKMV